MFMPLHWIIVHPIGDNSPLRGYSPAALAQAEPEVICVITADDETFAQTVHAKTSYDHTDLVWGARFRDMYLSDFDHVAIDPFVLSFTAAAALGAAAVFGLVPALRASRPDIIEVLRSSGRTAGLGSGRILRNVVVILNPSQNPDGHERFAAWSNSVAVSADEPGALEQSEPWSIGGRSNHYRFDMNRDFVAQSQLETRALIGVMTRWHPQLVVDLHSTTSQYFFPPTADPMNQNVGPWQRKWEERFGKANGAGLFCAHGRKV